MYSLGRCVFRKLLAKIGLVFIAALLFGTVFCQQASAQLTFTPSNTGFQTGDNIANLGSPTWVQGVPNSIIVYYVNHSDYKIVVDGVGTGLGHPQYVFNPQGLQIAVWNAEFTDVGAGVIYPCGSSTCPTMLINYVDPSQKVHFLTSTDMVHFTTDVIPNASSLGIGNQSPYPQIVPGLYSANQATVPAYVATIGGSDHLIYMSDTFDGVNFSELYTTGQPVSTYTTVSRPSMVISPTNGDTLIGFTSTAYNGARVAVVGPANTGPGAPVPTRPDIQWGNSNRNGNYAGLSLVEYNGHIWVFGQDTASSQDLKYMYAVDSRPLSFSAAVFPGNFQLRFTPSTILFNSAIYWIKQDDASTGIAWGYAQ